MAAFWVVVSGQLLHLKALQKGLTEVFGKALGLPAAQWEPAQRRRSAVEFADANKQHVLTPSRQRYRDSVRSCVECGFPVLLEGPAAVGKTSLIKAMCPTGFEIVNNTDTTTIQDYLGCIVPKVEAALPATVTVQAFPHRVFVLALFRGRVPNVSSSKAPCTEL